MGHDSCTDEILCSAAKVIIAFRRWLNIRLRDEYNFLRLNEGRVPAPGLDEKFTIVVNWPVSDIGKLNVRAAAPENRLGGHSITRVRRDVAQGNHHPMREGPATPPAALVHGRQLSGHK